MKRKTAKPASSGFVFALLKALYGLVTTTVCLLLTTGVLLLVLIGGGISGQTTKPSVVAHEIMTRFDNFMTNSISVAADGLLTIEKIFMLSDSDQVAPEPDQSKFGKTSDPHSLQWLFDEAEELLEGQELLFTEDADIFDGSEINYYLDDTIFAITWKQNIGNAIYTFSEVKIAHPTQIRRFLADGVFGSEKQYLTSEMASSVNAVVASAGDFYKHRRAGLVVYNGKVEKFNANSLDSCFIDDQGELIFSKAREFKTQEELQTYVDMNNIRFSLCFGPILIENGQPAFPGYYPVGEITDKFARAALCQLGPLHYMVVTANDEAPFRNFPNLYTFSNALINMGIEKAYTLDGGQTATIVMNDRVINHVSYGAERLISDIIYFATAIPD